MNVSKIGLSALLGLALTIGGTAGAMAQQAGDASGSGPFADVPRDYWAYGPIRHLHELKIVSGVDSSHFAPNSALTRAQFVDLLIGTGYAAKALHPIEYIRKPDAPYQDVAEKMWYYNDVVDAYNRGYLDSGAKFRPDQPITRDEMAVIAAKFYAGVTQTELNLRGDAVRDVPFSDWSDASFEGGNAALFLYNEGLVSGKKDAAGRIAFDFKGTLTRAEAAALFSDLYDRIAAGGRGSNEPVPVTDSATLEENGITFTIRHERDLLSVVADMGERPTTGYAVSISGISTEAGDTIVIHYAFELPKPGELQGQIVTHPKAAFMANVEAGTVYHYELKNDSSS